MHPAVHHVHEGHGQDVGVGPADVAVQREPEIVGRGPGHGQGHAEHGVGPEPPLARGPVEVDQGQVDPPLVAGLEARQDLADLPVHVLDGPEDALPPVPLAPVAPLGGLVRPGRRPRRDDGPAARPRLEDDLDLHGGIPPGVENLPRPYLLDRAHSP